MSGNQRLSLCSDWTSVLWAFFRLVVLVTAGSATQAQVTDITTGHVYQLVAAPGDWLDADQAARNTRIGDKDCHLVAITSQSEQDFIEANFDLTQTCGPSLTAWAGAFQESSVQEPPFDDGWQWVGGEPMTYTNWGGVEPNQSIGEEDCLELFPNVEWNDLQCRDIRSCYLIECGQQPLIQYPIGNQFQINTYTTNAQKFPDVAADADGNFVVVWNSETWNGQPEPTVIGRRYDDLGIPIGDEFLVGTRTGASITSPRIAMTDDGRFVVVWDRHSHVIAQLFDAEGVPVSVEITANALTQAWNPSVSINPDGRFMVVWTSQESSGTDSSGNSVQAQLFEADGTREENQFQVNTYTSGGQGVPAVSMDSAGNFVVVWTSNGSFGTDSSSLSVQGQRYDTAGNAVGGEFQVNITTNGNQNSPAVAMGAGGEFAVAWNDRESLDVRSQLYRGSGDLDGDEYTVNTRNAAVASYPTLTTDVNGYIVFVWKGFSNIKGRIFNRDGEALGEEIQVNTTQNPGPFSSVSSLPDSQFVVVWQSGESAGSDNDLASIQGQRFQASVVFINGFNSGDTSAWSNSVP